MIKADHIKYYNTVEIGLVKMYVIIYITGLS